MDASARKRRLTGSVQFKFILTFLVLIGALLAVMNTYPLIAGRDLIVSEKRNALTGQVGVIASSLSALDTLDGGAVAQVLELLDLTGLSRILVTDTEGRAVYDTRTAWEEDTRLRELELALAGNLVFASRFSNGAFASSAAVQVVGRGGALGAVYISEYDESQGELLFSLQNLLAAVSLAACAVAVALAVIFSRTLTARITQLADAIRVVRGGDYAHRLTPGGNDELTELGEEFNNLTERLETTEQQRRRFVSDASHELKTPLAAIRLLADSINQNADMDEETMREFVSDIGVEAERLQRTTEKLLDLSRRDDGAQRPKTSVDVGEVAGATLRMLKPLAEKMSVSLELRAQEDCRIVAVEDDVYQIIFNLAENAIKYNVEGGSVIIDVRREQLGEESAVLLDVADTGIGIPREDLPHIFSRFYRVDKARSREKGGSGLGLSIVHDAVAALDGSIEVSERSPQGTRFRVRFKAEA